MRYLAYIEWNPKDAEIVRTKACAIHEERKKFPSRYPTPLLHKDGTPIYYYTSLSQRSQGFALYEGTEEQVLNMSIRWIPEMNWRFIPIYHGSQVFETLWKIGKKHSNNK